MRKTLTKNGTFSEKLKKINIFEYILKYRAFGLGSVLVTVKSESSFSYLYLTIIEGLFLYKLYNIITNTKLQY